MAPEIALVGKRDRGEDGRDAEPHMPDENGGQCGLPPYGVDGFGELKTGEFSNALGEENETRRVVLIVASIRAIQPGAVEKLVSGNKEKLHSLRTRCFPDFTWKD